MHEHGLRFDRHRDKFSYIKTRNCSEIKPTVWFSDSVVPGVHGEVLSQASTLASESYVYDNAGRLLETQETPVGKGCTTRLYAYDEESNRTSLTTRAPGLEGKCATEGGTIQSHVYDEANRLTDSGVEYEAFGDTTKLPAVDAGEHEIKSTYDVDGQVATQEQNKTLDSYVYDPVGRTMETSSENTETKAKSTILSHYSGTDGAPTWTSEGVEKWSRNVPGIGGSLCATEMSSSAPVLQLHDLQGNIVATAADNETETKLLSTYNSTEFGVPSEGKTPPKYAWLGAGGLATETAFGTGIATQGGASYVPQVARDLQTAPPVPPGAFPNGQGTGEQFGSEIPGWYISLSAQESAATLAAWTAEQEQLAREAVGKAGHGCAVPTECVTDVGVEEVEDGEEGEEEEIEITMDERNEVGSAHIASGAPVIECNLRSDHPHRSTHDSTTVNFQIALVCTGTVFDVRLRAVLYFDGAFAGESGYVSKGTTSFAQENVAVACRSGTYQGWGYADWKLPDYDGPMQGEGWTIRRTVRC